MNITPGEFVLALATALVVGIYIGIGVTTLAERWRGRRRNK